MKKCARCHAVKDEKEFINERGGITKHCKMCREYMKEYRERNKEYLKEYGKEYYERNKEQKKEYEKRYRDWETDRKSTRLNSSHSAKSRMPSSA